MIAHGVSGEMSEEQFEKAMGVLQKIAANLFKSFDGMQKVWEERLNSYRHISEEDIPALLQKYQSWSRDVMEVINGLFKKRCIMI